MARSIEVLEGCGPERDGQWCVVGPEDDEAKDEWFLSRHSAMAEAAQRASEFGKPISIYADN